MKSFSKNTLALGVRKFFIASGRMEKFFLEGGERSDATLSEKRYLSDRTECYLGRGVFEEYLLPSRITWMARLLVGAKRMGAARLMVMFWSGGTVTTLRV